LTWRVNDFFATSNEIAAHLALNGGESARELCDRQRRTALAATHNPFRPIFGCINVIPPQRASSTQFATLRTTGWTPAD